MDNVILNEKIVNWEELEKISKTHKLYEVFMFRKNIKNEYDYTVRSFYYTNKQKAKKALQEMKKQNQDNRYDFDFNDYVEF